MVGDLQQVRKALIRLIQVRAAKVAQDPLAYGFWLDRQGEPFNPTDASLEQWQRYLITFDSYQRTEAMVEAMYQVSFEASAYDWIVQLFLFAGNICDAPWAHRQALAGILRCAYTKVSLIDFLDPDARAFYDSLPALVPVWRGCQRGRERGISWTRDRIVAEGFAWGKRCFNVEPTLVHAVIPKQHIFAVFVCRNESEIALDFRRLRKLQRENLSTRSWQEHYELVRKQKDQS
jgi:hypothetical protein